MIEVKNISKGFSGREILKDISLQFEKGKAILVIGGSGSGKTVLMKCMVGLLEVDKGEIIYDGKNFSSLKFRERKPFRQEIGMLFQGGALFDSQTVEENVIFPLSMFTNMNASEKRDRANFCLQRVNLLNANKLYPSELSGGMKKRVAIARAVVAKPKLILADEPTGNLDSKNGEEVMKLLQQLNEEGTTIIMVTHSPYDAGFSHRIVNLFDGKVVTENFHV